VILKRGAGHYEVIRAAETHRQFWKPEVVRTLLIAESHVFTSGVIRMCEPRIDELSTASGVDLKGLPREYVRVIYCLASGENWLLTNKEAKNASVWQFWDIFSTLANDRPQLIRRCSKCRRVEGAEMCVIPNALERLTHRVKTLVKLREKGVWLIDASAHALYGLDCRPHNVDHHLTWWKYFGSELVTRLKPQAVVFVGLGVQRALGVEVSEACSSIGNDRIRVVPQPNARNRSPKCNFSDWSTIRDELC